MMAITTQTEPIFSQKWRAPNCAQFNQTRHGYQRQKQEWGIKHKLQQLVGYSVRDNLSSFTRFQSSISWSNVLRVCKLPMCTSPHSTLAHLNWTRHHGIGANRLLITCSSSNETKNHQAFDSDIFTPFVLDSECNACNQHPWLLTIIVTLHIKLGSCLKNRAQVPFANSEHMYNGKGHRMHVNIPMSLLAYHDIQKNRPKWLTAFVRWTCWSGRQDNDPSVPKQANNDGEHTCCPVVRRTNVYTRTEILTLCYHEQTQ